MQRSYKAFEISIVLLLKDFTSARKHSYVPLRGVYAPISRMFKVPQAYHYLLE